MTQTQFDELYVKLYDAYESSMLKDEYVRSSLGDVLDHMILLKSKGCVTPDNCYKCTSEPAGALLHYISS